MSLHANPILFLNLGGEMLYVIHQRLRTQKIDIRKAKRVIEDVTAAVLNPKIISMIFQKSLTQELSWMRTTLEKIALSSIMKLDKDSMNKLFDLMMMMLKYQLVAATGPREVILITLNHLDFLRDNITNTNTQEWVTLTHRMLINYYGELTCDEIWQARNNCLNKLTNINVRVSVLLRLGLQNEDTTFNINPKNYDEKYEARQVELGPLKLTENSSEGYHVGSLTFNGDRVTLLGVNMYSPNYGNPPRPKSPLDMKEKFFRRDKGSKAEIDLLAKQLGTDNTAISRSFNFDIFIDEMEIKTSDFDHLDNVKDKDNDGNMNKNNGNDDIIKKESGNNKEKLDNYEYKNKLENICADFLDDTTVNKKMNLLQLLDETE